MNTEHELRADLLGEWIDKGGIELVLWDLDDTILDTLPLFVDHMNQYVTYINSFLPQFSKDSLLELMRETNNKAYKALSVSPTRWGMVAEDMAHCLGADPDIFKDGLSILMQIYDTAPAYLEGAEDALKTFRSINKQMGCVTHATKDWTNIKVKQRGLGQHFDRISIVDEFKFKGPEHWLSAINEFGIAPERTMVLGDNLGGDIRAAHSIGVENIVYFPGKWSVYNSGEIPEGTIVIGDKIKALVDTLVTAP